MLVLTRKRSESIRIGENIFIKVIRTGHGTVKIGIDAPDNVRIVRGELMPLTKGTANPDAELPPLFADDLVVTCSDQFPNLPVA